jgi:hypothetical protein
MTNRAPKLSERLELLPDWTDVQKWLASIEAVQGLPPRATEFDVACSKSRVASTRSLLALVAYFAEQPQLATSYAEQCLNESKEFLFGEWRNTYLAENKRIDPKWWKRNLMWMPVFEGVLLWGAVLGQWAALKEVGTFPEADGYLSHDYRAQERDLYVALGGFLRSAPVNELRELLDRAATGGSKRCKLAVAVVRACLARDAAGLQEALNAFLKHYKKIEFPKQDIIKKISVEGTLFVH